MNKLLTIDTDNAVIRFYLGQARLEGMPELAILHLRECIETLALGLELAHDTTYHVQVVTP